MANPNILSASSVVGFTGVVVISATAANPYFGEVASGKVRRITNLTICNFTTDVTTITLSIGAANHSQASGSTFLHQHSMAAGASFDAVNLDEPIYLQEATLIKASASNANKLNLMITYEEIT
jgi:hypothetical protein